MTLKRSNISYINGIRIFCNDVGPPGYLPPVIIFSQVSVYSRGEGGEAERGTPVRPTAWGGGGYPSQASAGRGTPVRPSAGGRVPVSCPGVPPFPNTGLTMPRAVHLLQSRRTFFFM